MDLLVSNGNGKGRYLAVAGDLGSLAGVRELVEAVHRQTEGLQRAASTTAPAFATEALYYDSS